jgi:Flp pilus assembly protein TadB
VSKERAQRRAVREQEAAAAAAARAAEAERKQRREARMQALTARLPKRRSRPGGVLAQRRRRQTSGLVAALVFLNLVVWLVSYDWALRAGTLMVSLLVAPVLHTLLFRRS